jgi:hypothetical protein
MLMPVRSGFTIFATKRKIILERNGFQALKHDVQKDIFKDEETIKSLHYLAMAELLREWFVLQNGPLLTPMRG